MIELKLTISRIQKLMNKFQYLQLETEYHDK